MKLRVFLASALVASAATIANADCREGSSDRTNFETTIKAYGA